MTCLNAFGCRSPLACDGFGYCRERYFTTAVEHIHARCECCGGHGRRRLRRPGDPWLPDCADCEGLGVILVEACPLAPEGPAVLAGDTMFQQAD